MNKLNLNDKTFIELSQSPPPWWKDLLSDKEIYAEIRKDNTLDVYYNGGAIITGLRYSTNGYTGEIHYKYLLPEKGEYIKYDFDNQTGIKLSKDIVGLLKLSAFNAKTLKRIKANISQYSRNSSEKGIQAKFILQTGSFIDSEFAYNSDKNGARIDLVWVDTKSKKIIFVELKTMGDSRLYNKGIVNQLKKYCDFIENFKNDIHKYYIRLFEIKKRLNLLPRNLKKIDSLSNYTVENKPLLLMGDCEQKWIDSNAGEINKVIKQVAVGAYYFGKPIYNCNLIKKTNRNRFIF